MVQHDRHSLLTLYSDPLCPFCHRTRLAIAEKDVAVTIRDISVESWPEDIAMSVPYGQSPVFVDHDLVLFDANIIIDYLDERFLHPPLLPYDPAIRAQLRLMRQRLDRDWYALWPILSGQKRGKLSQARQLIQEDLMVLNPLFSHHPYFMSSQFTILECSLAPLLWRLPMLNIKLANKAKSVEAYAERIFNRDSFQTSLTEHERAMR